MNAQTEGTGILRTGDFSAFTFDTPAAVLGHGSELPFGLTGLLYEEIAPVPAARATPVAKVERPQAFRLKVMGMLFFLMLAGIGIGLSVMALANWLSGIEGYSWYYGALGLLASLFVCAEAAVGLGSAWGDHVE